MQAWSDFDAAATIILLFSATEKAWVLLIRIARAKPNGRGHGGATTNQRHRRTA
jgi:hypothetical protein